MSDTPAYLRKSRALFRKFMTDHYAEYFEDMRHARVGPGTAYPGFHRHSEVIQHLRDIVHNLEETFGGVTIPGEFASPALLVDTWKWFRDFLVDRESGLFKDVFLAVSKTEDTHPEFLRIIYKIHQSVQALLTEILSMPEVKRYLKSGAQAPIAHAHHGEFDVIVMTALFETEFEALKQVFISFRPCPLTGDGTDYMSGRVGKNRVLLATDDKMGIAAATHLAAKLIAKFAPRYLIMAGIAAGVRDKEKAAYGDVLVARFTWNYESGKYKYDRGTGTTVFEPSPEQLELEAFVVPHINALKTDTKFLQSILDGYSVKGRERKGERPPRILLGPLASGSAVLADKGRVDSIRKGNRKLIGIDMETFGVFYAARNYTSRPETTVISIKSISDFADERKNDRYRNYAAYTSASIVHRLIEQRLT